MKSNHFQSLKDAYLGGGTNLAIRHNHPESIDIDLFFSCTIRKSGYKAIEKELQEYLGDRVLNVPYSCDTEDQYIFLRFWVKTNRLMIKVEVLQTTNFLDAAEEVNGARLATVRDIGLLKLVTAANRASFKDIYDLDYLTQDITLEELMDDLKKSRKPIKKINIRLFLIWMVK